SDDMETRWNGLRESFHSAGLCRGARAPGVGGMGRGFASPAAIPLVDVASADLVTSAAASAGTARCGAVDARHAPRARLGGRACLARAAVRAGAGGPARCAARALRRALGRGEPPAHPRARGAERLDRAG